MDCRLAVRQQAAGRCARSCQLSSMLSLFASRSCEQPPSLSPAERVPPAPHATTPPASCSTHSVSLVWHELNGRWHQLHGKLCILLFFYFLLLSLPSFQSARFYGAEDVTFENGKCHFVLITFQEIQVPAFSPNSSTPPAVRDTVVTEKQVVI